MSQRRDSHRTASRLPSSPARVASASTSGPAVPRQTSLEALEGRVLLSGSTQSAGNVFDVSRIPEFIASSGDLKDLKHGPMTKAGGRLERIYTDYRKLVRNGGDPEKFTSKSASDVLLLGSRIGVSVRTRGTIQEMTDTLHRLGGELLSRSASYGIVNALVPVSQLSSLAADGELVAMSALGMPKTASGKAENQGDIGQVADQLRTVFGVDGTGIKVGVLSDSAGLSGGGLQDSIDSGDLPKNTTILEDPDPLLAALTGFNTDEGRGMMEEIHDIAPGAQLFFATAGFDHLTMARNITALAEAGCTVIVDDLQFPDEPTFMDGIISQAITNAKEKFGVTYFSCSFNNAFSGFAQEVHWIQAPSGQWLADLDPSDNIDTRMTVQLLRAGTMYLQWDNPYNGVAGAATADLDATIYDPSVGAIVAEGDDANLVTGLPIETIDVNGFGTGELEIHVDDLAPGAKLPTVFRLYTGQPTMIGQTEYSGDRASVIGHDGGKDTISVGAVPFNLAPAFQDTAEVQTEDFSASGPVSYYFDPQGNRLKKPQKLMRPDFAAIDGVNTSFFGEDSPKDADKLPNFFGTSAAAPNAAAVGALLRQLVPKATPDEIRTALIASAKQNQINGAPDGSYDSQSGFGFIDALYAAHYLKPGAPVATFGGTRAESFDAGFDTATVTFSEKVRGFDISDLTLTRSTSSTNLLTGQETITTRDHKTFTISGLSPVTSKRGTYFLTLSDASSVRDFQGNRALGNRARFFVNGTPTNLRVQPVNNNEIDVSWSDNTANETGFRLFRSDTADFRGHVVAYNLPKNTTLFKSTGLREGLTYYYRVRANVPDGNGSPMSSVASATPLSRNEVVVDNRSSKNITVRGIWTTMTEGQDVFGPSYLNDGGTGGGKSITFTPRLPATGAYFVYVRSVPGAGRATNVPVSVAGNATTFNERDDSGWVLLGKYNLGNGDSVVISNNGANGSVAADAVRFVKATGGVTVSSVARSAATGSLFSTSNQIGNDDLEALLV